MLPLYQPPAKYTGEHFGVEYLYDQSGLRFLPSEENLDQEIDEGFEDVEAAAAVEQPLVTNQEEDPSMVADLTCTDSDSDDEEEVCL